MKPKDEGHFCWRNICLAAAGIALPIAILEISLRAINHRGMDLNVEMFKYASKLKKSSSDKKLGHEHVASKKAHLMGVDVTTNNIGLRDQEDYDPTVDNHPNRVRVAFVGDSFTMGWGVDQNNVIPELLEKKLNKIPECKNSVRVFNLGVGNYNSTQELQAYIKYSEKLNPHAVILLHFINDAEPYKQSQPSIIDKTFYTVNFFRSRIKSKNAGDYYQYYSDLYNHPTWNGNKAALVKLNELVLQRTGTPLTIYALPELREISPTSRLNTAYTERKRFFENQDFIWHDLKAHLHENSGENPSKLWVSDEDSHSNKYANALIADQITQTQKDSIRKICNKVHQKN